jgi:HAD superfamily hydrolase (TIGR01549 family)
VAIKVVTFDFWGTLYRNITSLKHERKARIRHYLDRGGIEGVSDEAIYEAMADSWVIWDAIWRDEQRTLNAKEFLMLVFPRLGITLEPQLFEELSENIQEAIFTGNTVPTDHIIDVVEQISEGRQLGIISDTGVSSGRYLQRLIDRDHPGKFSFGLYSDELGMAKPQIGVFKQVLAITGCQAHEVVHVGDLLHTDVLGAREAGMHSVRYIGVRNVEEEGYAEADHVIDDYRLLPRIIKELSQ